MITCVVFSKDRSAQLDLLLTSIWKNSRFLLCDLRVLYTFSSLEYELGYEILIKEWGNLVTFIKEENFHGDLISASTTDSPLIMYFTDDDIVYRKIPLKISEIKSLFDEIEVGCLSLRLGRNTVIQNPYTNEQAETPKYIANIEDRFIIWNRNSLSTNSNYAYNLSVDAHIFRSKTIHTILKSFVSEHPNDFEGKLQNYTQLVSPVMASPPQSYVVGVPVNKTNDKVGNENGKIFPESSEYLNSQYIKGKRIQLEKIEFLNVIGCHQEFALPME